MRTSLSFYSAFCVLLSTLNAFAQVTSVTGAIPAVSNPGSTASPPTSPSATLDNKSALVIIDMQPQFVTRGGHDKDPENQKKVKTILETQLAAIKAAEKAKIPIVFLEYAGFGDTNSVLKQAAAKYKNVSFIQKSTDGMFESDNTHEKELESFLEKNKIKNLYITGANGGACVSESIRGALQKKYNVVAITDGIADFNFDNFIYPYVNQYSEFKDECKDPKKCSFIEIEDLKFALRKPAGQSAAAKDCDPQPELQGIKKAGHSLIKFLEGK